MPAFVTPPVLGRIFADTDLDTPLPSTDPGGNRPWIDAVGILRAGAGPANATIPYIPSPTPLVNSLVAFDGLGGLKASPQVQPNATGVEVYEDDGVTLGQVNAAGLQINGVAAGLWSVSGSDVYRDSGNVSIGTTPDASTKFLVRAATDSNWHWLTDELKHATDSGTSKAFTITAGAITLPSSRLLPALGSASAAAYSFNGDPDTGIYSPGADQVGIATGGSQRVWVTSNARVGVNINPSVPFHVYHPSGFQTMVLQANSTLADLYLQGTTTTPFFVGFRAAGNALTLLAGGTGSVSVNSVGDLVVQTDAMVVDISEKKTGFGTGAPQEKVDVVGNLRITGDLKASYSSGAADPTTGNIGTGTWRVWKNTTSGDVFIAVNDGGVIKKSAAFT